MSEFRKFQIKIRTIIKLILAAYCTVVFSQAVQAGRSDEAGLDREASCLRQVEMDVERAIREDEPSAQFRLANTLYDRNCGEEALGMIHRLLENAAFAGHAEAAYVAARIVLEREQTNGLTAHAIELLEIAAAQNHVPAQHLAGMLKLAHARDAAERQQGLTWLVTAAHHDGGLSALSLGMIYERGLHGVVADVCLAIKWYDVAEASGMVLGARKANQIRNEHLDQC